MDALSLFSILAHKGIGSNLFVLLYLGPETIMPVASIIAAALGFLLIVWRHVATFFKKIARVLYARITHKPLDEELVFADEPAESPDEMSNL